MPSSTSGSSWCRARQKRGRWVLGATDPRALHGPSWLSFLLPPEDEEEEEEDSLHMARGCSSHAGREQSKGSPCSPTAAAPRGEGVRGGPCWDPAASLGHLPPVSPSSPRGGVITGASGEMTCRSALAEKGLSIL